MSAALNRLRDALKAHGCNPNDHGEARCPAHDDQRASLTFGKGNKGAVLRCHAGCEQAAVVAALGLKMSDLFDDDGPASQRREAEAYDYTDEAGELLFQVVRFEPKDFRQRRPDGRGGWDWKLGNTRRVLYRLPKVIEAVKAGRTVYVVEGEKDAATLVAWGLDATSNPGGAGKWKSEYSEALRGARVVIIPDADKPGREHAEAVRAALAGIAAEARVIEIPAGKDVSEWASAHGGTREALERLVQEAQPGRNSRQLDRAPLIVCTATELLNKTFPPREPLLSPWMSEKDTAMLYAPRGTGKTLVGMGVAVAVASGGRFLRFAAPRARRVLYVDGELPAETLQRRVMGATLAGDGRDTADNLRILAADLQELGIPSLSTPEGQALIAEHLEGVALLVLDSISTLCRGGEENTAESWQPIQDWLLTLRRRGIAVLLIHHAGKTGQQRGTSKREDILDVVVNLKRPPDYTPNQGARFQWHFEKARSLSGCDVDPFEAELDIDDHDAMAWTMRDLKAASRDRILSLDKEGYTGKEIAGIVGVHKSRVSHVLSDARKEGVTS